MTKALRTFNIAHPVDPLRVGDWQVRKLTAFRIIIMGIGFTVLCLMANGLLYGMTRIVEGVGISQSPYYSTNDLWFSIIKLLQPALMFIQIWGGLYMIISGLLFHKRNLVKYVYHFHMSTFVLSMPCIFAFHFAGMLFIPSSFPGFKEIATSLLTVIFIYLIVRQAKNVYAELDQKEHSNARSITNSNKKLGWITLIVSAIPAFSVVIISRLTGINIREQLWSFLTPVFFLLSFAIGLFLVRLYIQDFFYSYYLLRYTEAFRLYEGAPPHVWYGDKYTKSAWVKRQLSKADELEEELINVLEQDHIT